MGRRILILRNPAAGRGGAAAVAKVAAAARHLGLNVEIDAPPDAEAMIAAAAAAACDALAIAGGDGTVRLLAPLLAARGLPLVLIPTGTANILALEARAPRNAAAIASALADGRPLEVPWGRANGAPFVVVAGAGLDGAAALQAVPWKASLGRAAYWAGIAQSALAAHSLHVRIDGAAPRPADWMLCTAARQASRRLMPRLYLATFTGGAALRPLQLAAVAASRLAAAPGVALTPFADALIEATPAAPTEIDGEPLGQTPLTLRAEDAPLLLLRPAAAG